MKRLAIDVCVSTRVELELWRAGYEVAVRAGAGEMDHEWLARAVALKCDAVITRDRGVVECALTLGMRYIQLDAFAPADYQHKEVLDELEWLEGRQ